MKIKFTISKSSSAETEKEDAAAAAAQKKRGRPRKDPKAIHEAALAALTPNQSELQERKIRRQAAEEKIRKSVSADGIYVMAAAAATEAALPGKRVKLEKSLSSDYVDILGSRRELSSMPASLSSSTSSMPSAASFVMNPNENEFVQKSKNTLNVALQQDQGMIYAPSFAPFAGFSDAVERLLPYHLALNAGQYDSDATLKRAEPAHLEYSFSALLARFKSAIHAQHSKPVCTELLLLEQRLCLEEEKFLLQKMKSDYNARYMALASQVSTRSTTPKQ
jgi:hypothetical protein